jgi:probable H4MPT-linked C1 transfer pathway protein
LLATCPPADVVAVTMTGELADCYQTKAEGVSAILRSVCEAADGRPVWVYLVDGRFLPAAEAKEVPLLAAASNWHALAAFAGRFVPAGSALVVDIGSTTTDLVPLYDGEPVPRGLTDPERLASGELVYTGVVRSPVFGLVGTLPWRGRRVPVAQEWFATTLDAYLLLGELEEEPVAETGLSRHTADGRPATAACAVARLARCLCADTSLFTVNDALACAAAISAAQLALLVRQARRVLALMRDAPRFLVVSGQGEFLARRLIQRLGLEATMVSLSERLGAGISCAAAAYAAAVLARQRDHG